MKTFILGVLVFTLIAVLGGGISADSETSGLGAEVSDVAGLENAGSGADAERLKRQVATQKRAVRLEARLEAGAKTAIAEVSELAKAALSVLENFLERTTSVATNKDAAAAATAAANFLVGTFDTPRTCRRLIYIVLVNLDLYELKELAIVFRNIFISQNTYVTRKVAVIVNNLISGAAVGYGGAAKRVSRGVGVYSAKNEDYHDEIPGEDTTEVEHLASDLANAARLIIQQAFGTTRCVDLFSFIINTLREAELWYLASAIIRIAEYKPGFERTWVATVLIKALKANCLPVIRKWESAKHYAGTSMYGHYGVPPANQYNAEVPELIRKAFGDKCNPQMLGYLPTIQVAEIYVQIKNSDKEECPAGGYETHHPQEPYHPPSTSYPPKDYDAPDYPTSDYHPPTPEYPPKQEYNKKTPEYKPPKKKVPYTQPSYKTPEKYTPPPTYEYTPPETPEYPAEYPSEPQTYENPYPEADPYTEPSYTEPPSYPAETSYPEDSSYSAGYQEEPAEYPPYGSDME